MTDGNQAKQIASDYRRFLRQMKAAKLKIADMPDDVAQSALVLHQHALLVTLMERHNDGVVENVLTRCNSKKVKKESK
jgi:hypothetical protein